MNGNNINQNGFNGSSNGYMGNNNYNQVNEYNNMQNQGTYYGQQMNNMNYQQPNYGNYNQNNAPKSNKVLMYVVIVVAILIAVAAVVYFGFIRGGSSNPVPTPGEGTVEQPKTETIKGNCHAIDCIKKINPEDTVEQINSIIGFDGELTDEKYNIYYWKISENEGIKVAYYSGSKGTISVDIDRSTIADSKVNFSRYNELQAKVKSGIKYDEFITYLGSVDGVITEKSSYSTEYTWVSTTGDYLIGTFSNSSNQCTFVISRIK